MIGKVSDEVKQQMNKEILHFSFGMRCLSTSLMALEMLVETFKRNSGLFVCLDPLAIPACTEHRTWLGQFQLHPGVQNMLVAEMHLQLFLQHSKHKLLLGGEEWLQNVSRKGPRPYLL